MECEQAFGCIVAEVKVILFQEFANDDSALCSCIGSNCMHWSLEKFTTQRIETKRPIREQLNHGCQLFQEIVSKPLKRSELFGHRSFDRNQQSATFPTLQMHREVQLHHLKRTEYYFYKYCEDLVYAQKTGTIRK